jgi:4-hydroxy-L-threonine phosphate dehydrogenase PdxA
MEDRKIRVAIAHGDTNGIGYELIFKTFSEPEMLELCTPIIYGSPKVAAYHRKALEIEANFTIISGAEDARGNRLNMLPCFDEDVKVELGESTEESNAAAMKALDKALSDYRDGKFDVLVTAPLRNGPVKDGNETFACLSDYVANRLGEEHKNIDVMVNSSMRVAILADNRAIQEVSKAITEENLTTKVEMLMKSLKRDFRLSNPRVAVLSLNADAQGAEEKNVLAPTVVKVREQGNNVFGPYTAENIFGTGRYDAFDGILAMYHDQGTVPFRSIGTDEGCLFTTGLSLPFATCMKGALTGADGKEDTEAGVNSFRRAIYMAIDSFRHRQEYDEPTANPLQKLYHERRDESEKVRFSVSKRMENGAPRRFDSKPATASAPEKSEAPATVPEKEKE